MTKKEAIQLYESNFWENMTFEERAKFQLFEPLLCMPFDVFHEAVEKTLGRPVWTHEFGSLGKLKEEFLGERPAPTFGEIMKFNTRRKKNCHDNKMSAALPWYPWL